MHALIQSQLAEWKQAGKLLAELFRTRPGFRYASAYFFGCLVFLYAGQLYALSLLILAGSCWFFQYVNIKCRQAEARGDGSDIFWAFLLFYALVGLVGSIAAVSSFFKSL